MPSWPPIARLCATVALPLLAMIMTVVMFELGLRYLHPVYASAASADLASDDLRIWFNRPNRRSTARHPDTGVEHPLVFNGLGLRQSRDFSDLESRTNLGFFGDSFTINVGLPVVHSFTEPLDYLLNVSDDRFNVLNFGVNGYSTGQSFQNYQAYEGRSQLQEVFYVLCVNDLRNIYETNQFRLSTQGELIRNEVPPSPWWIRLVARLHTTYLLLDVRQRWLLGRRSDLLLYRQGFESKGQRSQHETRFHSAEADALEHDFLNDIDNAELERVKQIFMAILSRWQQVAHAHGAEFSVVLLPFPTEEKFHSLLDGHVPVISLSELMLELAPSVGPEQLTFREDAHWAELGNMLAAKALYRFLTPRFGLMPINDEEIDRALTEYYAALDPQWQYLGPPPADLPAEKATLLRARYLALEE